jgi:predicted dienelactone hydrolase
MKKILAAFAILLAGCASTPSGPDSKAAADVPLYSTTQDAGEIPVGVIPQALLRDPQRSRDIEVYIDYPTRGGPHPVLLFSHALGASGRTYVFMTSYWASHGYVVIRVRHADATREGVATINDDWENQTPADWRNRTRDLSFVIDSLGTLEEQYPELKGKMDHARIGVAGHSYGAFTAMLLGDARTFSGTTAAASYADARVKAIVAMSPQGPGERRGLTRDSWTELKVPTLFLTGSSDRGAAEGEDEAWRRQAFELSPVGDKWFVSLTGASQYTFAGRMTPPPAVVERAAPTIDTDPRTGRPIPISVPQPRATASNASSFLRERQLFNVVRTVTLAFWDTYLKNEGKGREYLTKLSGRGDMTVETK